MADFDRNRFRSAKQEWETPDDLFQGVRDRYDLNFDLAADQGNAKMPDYFTEEDDALSVSWAGLRGWLNPPYGGTGKNKLSVWVEKAYRESRSSDCVVAMLIPARTNTNWWHDYCMRADEILFVKGRPKFVGNTHGLPQPLAIVFWGSGGSLLVGSITKGGEVVEP